MKQHAYVFSGPAHGCVVPHTYHRLRIDPKHYTVVLGGPLLTIAESPPYKLTELPACVTYCLHFFQLTDESCVVIYAEEGAFEGYHSEQQKSLAASVAKRFPECVARMAAMEAIRVVK